MKKHQISGDVGVGAPLLPRESSTNLFNAGPRRRNDVGWLVAFLLVLGTALGGGIYAFINSNPRFLELISPDKLRDPATCPMASHARRSLKQSDADQEAWRADAFMAHALGWTSLAVGGSLVMGLGFLALVRKSARALVYTAIGLQIGLPAVAAVSFILNGAAAGAIPMVILVGILVLLFVLWREQIALVMKLLGVAGRALIESPSLIGFALALQFVWAVALAAPLALSGFLAYTNGDVTYNGARVDGGTATSTEQCKDVDGDQVLCCVWTPEQWVIPYLSLVSLALTWSTFLVFEIKVFTVSGVVGQWYFTPVASSSQCVTPAQRAPLLTSLRHALGPSIGSLCFGSAVLTLVSYLRQALQKAREEAGRNILALIASSLLSFLYGLLEYLTKFATVRMALTGESFMTAGRSATDLLLRNSMNALGVWWLPPLILQNCAFVAAGAWAGGMWLLGYTAWSSQPSALGSAWALSILAFFVGWAVLAFFCSLLLNVVDAVFLCFAMDRDMAVCTRLEVHEVYCQLPTVGAVVEQPGGEVAYGQPAAVRHV